MTQSYELWEGAIGKRLARSQDAAEIASIIRTLLSRHGSSMLGDLELYLEDEAGETIETYAGAKVANWADDVSARATAAVANA